MRSIRVDFRKRKGPVDPPPTKARVRSTGSWTPRGVQQTAPSGVFLPDMETQVKLIAMRGFTDDEIAQSFGISADLIAAWRKQYPGFNNALETGRTMADAEVLWGLHRRATGNCPVPHTEVIKFKDHYETLDMEKHFPPDTEAAKTWMKMRQREHWREERAPSSGRQDPLDKPRESKAELIAAIVGMIRPKSDEPGKRKT